MITKFSNAVKELKAPLTVYVRDFDQASAENFHKHINEAVQTGQPIVPIVISSYGGFVYSLLSMISDIKACPVPVATIVQGMAMSCGAVLASCGKEGLRFMDPNSTIMIHQVSSATWGKIEDIKTDLKQSEHLNDLIFDILAENCQKSKSYWRDVVKDRGNTDLYLNGKEALEHNLVNHLRVPQLTTFTKTIYNFDGTSY